MIYASLRTSMKYFKHYKNKPYKFKGIARHSENLEELVVYETLYDNPKGKLWARPKNMFFENIEKDGVKQPRFAEIPLEIKSFTEFDSEKIKTISFLMQEVLGSFDESHFRGKLNKHKNFYIAFAYLEGKPVGFKVGFQQDHDTFYSWIGGVLPESRGLGVAAALMKNQHEWCIKQGFKKVQTKSQNRWRDMVILNLRHGFNIIGASLDEKNDLEILLEKVF